MSTLKTTRKFFLCTGECVPGDQLASYPSSHIIGELCYVLDEGQRVSALAVYEKSLPSSNVPPVETEIRVEIIGDARRIKCRYPNCYHYKRWMIGKAAFMQMQQRYGKPML